jgi:DNA-directed RNA polymerase alpha subunit
MEYQYHLENEEDFVDLILNLKSIVNKRKEKLLSIKENKDGEI